MNNTLNDCETKFKKYYDRIRNDLNKLYDVAILFDFSIKIEIFKIWNENQNDFDENRIVWNEIY